MIAKRYKLYKNFGKCMEISNGTVKALVTVDIGPRVIYYGVKGMNIMHESPLSRMTTPFLRQTSFSSSVISL